MRENAVAVLTAPGRSALATLGVAGTEAWQVVRRLFRSPKEISLPEQPETGRFWLGRLGDDLTDEVVLAVRASHPVIRLEIHGHGGKEIVSYLVELFQSAGATLIPWEEWIEDNSPETVAQRMLPHALTLRTASILLDQMHGALQRELDQAKTLLQVGEVALARQKLTQLRDRRVVGQHLTKPFTVVIAGAPNVGKSSLVNALAGYQRSIVSPTPGTTRDLVTTSMAVDGWPIALTDSAGLRMGGNAIESLGIEQARSAIATADVCLWLVDASKEPVWPEITPPHLHLLVNKIDLPAAWDAVGIDALHVSATTGRGIAELCAALSRWLVPEVIPPGAGVPLSGQQAEEVEEALASI